MDFCPGLIKIYGNPTLVNTTQQSYNVLFFLCDKYFYFVLSNNLKKYPMPLTANQFYSLPEVHQLRLIVETSVIIGERREAGFEYVLYNIEGLYVEETRSLYDEEFSYFNCIEDTDLLLPYTEEFSVLMLEIKR